jgi:hypothetical protein
VAVSCWVWPAPSVPRLGVWSLLLACGGDGKVGDRLRDVGKTSWNGDAVSCRIDWVLEIRALRCYLFI